MTHSPYEFDVHLAYLQRERLREAHAERLARLAEPRPAYGLRSRLAAALYALADRLDNQCPPALESAYGRISSS